MTDAQLWSMWQLWVAVAAAVVIIAAALLVTIWLTARRILAEALRALAAAERIEERTRVIWQLQATNDLVARVLAHVEAIELKGRILVRALSGDTVARH